jgi:hypothetical protein
MQAFQHVPGYHRLRNDGLYEPVRFVFVNDGMRDRIMRERQSILERLAPLDRAHQVRIFDAYDPDKCHRSFQDILQAFCPTRAA